MSARVAQQLSVLVTGYDNETAYDVARLATDVGASVTLAAGLGAGVLDPQVVICCCGADMAPGGRPASDLGLSEQAPGCQALAVTALPEAIVLHAAPLRRASFDSSITVLRHPTVRGLVERAAGPGGLTDATAYVRAAAPSRSPRRPQSTGARSGGRLRLTADPALPRADAA